jgi:peptidoglycan L-alanyl-D-glutamate endopeptidase CwlK
MTIKKLMVIFIFWLIIIKEYMPNFSQRSLDNLENVHPDLVTLMHESIKEFDFTVICGQRTQAQQQELYKQGRTKPGKKVTNIDGIKKKSKHNYSPSLAVDIVPFPIDWNDLKRFKALSVVVLRVAKELKAKGLISSDIEWGGNFRSLVDYPHYQIK